MSCREHRPKEKYRSGCLTKAACCPSRFTHGTGQRGNASRPTPDATPSRGAPTDGPAPPRRALCFASTRTRSGRAWPQAKAPALPPPLPAEPAPRARAGTGVRACMPLLAGSPPMSRAVRTCRAASGQRSSSPRVAGQSWRACIGWWRVAACRAGRINELTQIEPSLHCIKKLDLLGSKKHHLL